MIQILTNIRDFLWGYPSLLLLGGFGIFITFKTRFFPLTDFFHSLKTLFNNFKLEKDGKITPLMSISTALGGTVGIGSIVGISLAISVGGVGVVFWMWVSAFFGMMVKFSECALAVKYRDFVDGGFVGGTPYILKKKKHGKLAILFAVLCVLTSFGTGSITQINALSETLGDIGVKKELFAFIVFFSILIIVIGGQRIIAKANEILMPISSIVYIFATLVIIIINFQRLPFVVFEIIRDAFGLDAIGGGIFAGSMMHSFRVGFSKGVFSHEAGMGTSPIAHAANDNATPFSQGVFGMFEVFFDTFIIGTLTAFSLILSGERTIEGMVRIYFGDVGVDIFIILLIIFVIAASISWCFYALSCLRFLTNNRTVFLIYRILFAFSAMMGCFVSSQTAWVISDILNIILMFPNLFLLFKARAETTNIVFKNKRNIIRKGKGEKDDKRSTYFNCKACFDSKKQHRNGA